VRQIGRFFPMLQVEVGIFARAVPSIRIGILTRRMSWLCSSGGISALSTITMAWLRPSIKRADFSSKCKKSTVSLMPQSGNCCQANLWNSIGNDVMEGADLMNSLPNSKKPPRVKTLFHLTYKCLFSYDASPKSRFLSNVTENRIALRRNRRWKRFWWL
jgi:hypothetical protein